MFDADRPIVSQTQDRLGRTTFAKYLARCILDNKNTASLTIGLYGNWGVGKTSVINLMLEELRFAASNMEEDKPVILNFSGWSYSGQNQLIYNFFRRLSSVLNEASNLPQKDRIVYLLELYISYFTHKAVPPSLRSKHLFSRQIKEENIGWQSGQDLTLVKTELNSLLKQQKHKIIIIIDNIMRLDDNEIKQIFQIVKSIGDFENTSYVLAIDKNQMINILNHLQLEDGNEYLDKMIQLPFEIPPISYQDLETILLDRLQVIFKLVPEGRWDIQYWADIYYGSLKYLFRNVRDIARYVNILGFSYEHVKEVVNPVDFFTITALQVFVPEIYDGIRDNRDLFTDLVENVYEFDEAKLAEDKLRCDEILQRVDNETAKLVLQLLIRLFPRLRNIYEANIPFYHSERIARKNLRICTLDLFEVYFRLSMPTGVIPESEMNACLSLVKDEEGFTLELMRLNQDDKILKFLDLLDSHGVAKVKTPYVAHLVNALMDSADLFPPGIGSVVSFSTPMRIHRIIHQVLRRFDNQEERFNLLNHAINRSTNSLYISVHELLAQAEEHAGEDDTVLPLEHRDFTADQLQELKQTVVKKINYWAETKRLIDHPKLLPILYAWKAWGENHACQKYVAEITKEDKGLIAFLQAAFHELIEEIIQKQEKSNASSYLVNVSNFIEPKLLEKKVVSLFEDLQFEKLREKEQLAILIFLDLTKAETVKIIPKTG